MALPVFRRFSIADIPSAPSWLESVFPPLNLFCEGTINALTKNLVIGQNVQGGKYSTQIKTPSDYISGGFTNHFYDKEKKILVSYYRDTNSLTMVKSIQPYTVNRVGVGPQRFYGMPLVFQWLPRGKQATY